MNSAVQQLASRTRNRGLVTGGDGGGLSAAFSPTLTHEQDDKSWLHFEQEVDVYTESCAVLWKNAAPVTPCLGSAAIPLPDKLEREAKADRYRADLETRLERFPRSRKSRKVWREALVNRTRDVVRSTLGISEDGLQPLLGPEGVAATSQFVREAKRFDPGITDASLFQALRNLWIVNSVQLLLDKPISLSPATFGYSMLYPWTDNLLDDPLVPRSFKLAFGAWLEKRLRGMPVAPGDAHAAQVSQLVALIERCFPRDKFEEVYLSLRAIHQSQMNSLEQHQSCVAVSESELLRLTFRKGGTSVLPDALLVSGTLSEAEAEFMFGFGVLLQLLDDLQDLQTDWSNGHATLFARAAGGSLDEVAARLWSFAQAILWSFPRFAERKYLPVKMLIQESCKLMLLQGVARSYRLYSADFVAALETYSPFRFSYLRDRETSFTSESDKLLSLLREKSQLRSAFEVLV